jgi:hypothetical protein
MDHKLFAGLIIVLMFSTIISACGGGGDGGGGGVATLSSISISPANGVLYVKGTQQFTATGHYSDGTTKDLTSQSTWASSNQSVATIISTSGLATGVVDGTTTISATEGGVSGDTTLNVTTATLSKIVVTPANPSIPVGVTEPFVATGTYTDSSTYIITQQVTWNSGTPSVATIDSKTGLATGVATGSSVISATLGTVSGNTTLSVTAAILKSIAVTPDGSSIIFGAIQQFTATGTFTDGSPHNITTQCTWNSDTASVATINKSGLAAGVGSGTSTITAKLGSISGSTILTVVPQDWTWVSGSDTFGTAGNYGGAPSPPSNGFPGARDGIASCIDSQHNRWVFGGYGRDSAGNIIYYFNDLWKYDGTNWTWVSGSNIVNQKGSYGIQQAADPTNIPGARGQTILWTDSQNNLWLFGGQGYDSNGNPGSLNDLWKYDGTNWTWVSGSNIVNQKGSYGTKGTASSANIPGARYGAVSWIDSQGKLWLFGGQGYDSAGTTLGYLNDLWKYDGTNWTWVFGSKTVNQAGTYYTLGTANSLNVPGARYGAVSWIESQGKLWFFGGYGWDSAGNTTYYLNDLWKYDGTNWTWASGSNTGNQAGKYGTLGIAYSLNVPGARYGAVSWIDSQGYLWLFGGYGYDSAGTTLGSLNDLWKYAP